MNKLNSVLYLLLMMLSVEVVAEYPNKSRMKLTVLNRVTFITGQSQLEILMNKGLVENSTTKVEYKRIYKKSDKIMTGFNLKGHHFMDYRRNNRVKMVVVPGLFFFRVTVHHKDSTEGKTIEDKVAEAFVRIRK